MNSVNNNRTAYRVVAGRGYQRMGAPAMPANLLGPPSACEPPSGTVGGLHWLNPPAGREAPQVRFTWHPAGKEWETFGHVGNRAAFTSAYLAACGWTYGAPV